MKKSTVFFLAIFLTACASTASNNAKVNIPDPGIEVEQISSTPAVAEHVTGGVPINLAMAVTNHATIPITLKRVNVQSIGTGGYNVPSTSRPFKDIVIQPGATEQVQFWVGAYADTSVAGVNGAVALRVIAQFDSSLGAFEYSSVHQVQGRIM
jgi:hypothetical protein